MKFVSFCILSVIALAFGRILRENNQPKKDGERCPEDLKWFDCSYNVSCKDYELESNELAARNCSPGCYCPEQYYSHQNKCFRYQDCPNVIASRKKCPEPLKWDDCYFNITCSEYPITSSEYERKTCRPGCFCPRDHYVYGHKCYYYTDCPDECTGQKRWSECGNFCQDLCPVLQPPGGCGKTPECSSGCFCRKGKRKFASHCLKLEDCPTDIQKSVLSEIKSDFAYMEI